MIYMRRKLTWNNALAISCCLHLVLLSAVGAIVFISPPPEVTQYLELEIASDSQVDAQPASALPQTQQVSTTVSKSNASAEIATEALQLNSVGSSGGTDNTSAALAGAITANPGSSAGAYAPSSRILKPRILQKVEPVYPEDARQAGKEGRVVLSVEILADGNTGAVSVSVSSGQASLDQAAMQAVRQWRFVPAKDEASGQAVDCHTSLPITFKLTKA